MQVKKNGLSHSTVQETQTESYVLPVTVTHRKKKACWASRSSVGEQAKPSRERVPGLARTAQESGTRQKQHHRAVRIHAIGQELSKAPPPPARRKTAGAPICSRAKQTGTSPAFKRMATPRVSVRGFAHNGTPGGNFHNRQGFFYFFWTIFVTFDKIDANCAENAHIARRDAHRTEMFKKKHFFLDNFCSFWYFMPRHRGTSPAANHSRCL